MMSPKFYILFILFFLVPLFAFSEDSNNSDTNSDDMIRGIKDPNLSPNDPRSRLIDGVHKILIKIPQGKTGTGVGGNGDSGDSSSGGGDANSKMSSKKNSSAGGNGSGNGGDTGKSIGFDDNANKNNGGGGNSSGGSSSTPGGSVQIFDKWWPVCAFIDQNIGEAKANSALKGMVDMAAACQVNIVLFPVTIRDGYPNDPDAINNASTSKCNVDTAGVATAGSATTLVNPGWKYTAAEMCKAYVTDPNDSTKQIPNEQVAGCAQLRSGTNDPRFKRDAKPDGEHMSAASGGVAASIEVFYGQNDLVVSHESLGHSEMGKPNGSRYGNGIGEFTTPPEQPEPETLVRDWTKPAGCDVLKSKALDNSKRFSWDPSQQTYYTKQTNPAYQYDLMNGTPLFNKSGGPPPPPSGPLAQDSPNQRIGFDDNATGKEAPLTTGSASVGVDKLKPKKGEKADADMRHKRKPADALLARISGKKSGDDADTDPPAVIVPPPDGKGMSNARIGFDDDAAKNMGGGGSAGADNSVAADAGSSTLGAGAQSSEAPDEGAAIAAPANNGKASSQAIGFDDNASKNGGGGDGSGVSSVGREGGGGAPAPADAGTSGVNIISGQSGTGSMDNNFFNGIGKEEDEDEPNKPKKRKAGAGLRSPASTVKVQAGAYGEPQ